MFQNSVLKPSVSTKMWIKKASVRAVKTIAQSIVAGIGTSMAINQVDWKYIISVAILTGIVSILTSIAGIPEVKTDGAQNEQRN